MRPETALLHRGARFFAAVWIAAALGGCESGPRIVSRTPPPDWEAATRAWRASLDDQMRSDESPLPAGQRDAFPGLRFYDPDPRWYFRAEADTREAGQARALLDTRGELRHYRVHARLHLETPEGERFTLTVYRSAEDGRLFLPVQDATAGVETYGMGRYVDVTEAPDGSIAVDFNRARNPYCAYESSWVCPTVPEENRIDVAIRAGERTPPKPS